MKYQSEIKPRIIFLENIKFSFKKGYYVGRNY